MNKLSLEINGTWFEQHVANCIVQQFPNTSVLHNLLLYSNFLSNWKGKPNTTQIDLVVIAEFGCYIIEAKKWGLEIVGNRDDYKWSGKSNAKSFIDNINPVSQNLMHIRALRNLLRINGYKPPQFESFVCVPNGTQTKTDCEEVLELSQLIFKLKYDRLQFLTHKSDVAPIDVQFWERAVSQVIRKNIAALS